MNLTKGIVTISVATDGEVPGTGNIIAIGASLNNSGGYKTSEFHARIRTNLFPKRENVKKIIPAMDMSIGVEVFPKPEKLIESFWKFYNEHLYSIISELLFLSVNTTIPLENLLSQCGIDLKSSNEKNFYRPKSIMGLSDLLPILTNGKYYDFNDYARDFMGDKRFDHTYITSPRKSPLGNCQTALLVFRHLMIYELSYNN